jgi:CHASE2 domain-containing sensor protein
VLDWLTDKLTELQELIQLGAIVIGMVMIVITWWRTKALVPTLTIMVVAGAVIWAVANIEWFEKKVGEETQGLGPRIEVTSDYVG